jgi:cytochrome c oxidase assembly protein subunit 15
LVALIWTTFLLYAGGFTTSIEAGMAFLDWPLSNGSINPDGWLTEPDKMAEHSHRLLGAIVGMLVIVIAVWTHWTDSRVWMRRLAWGALALVVFQGLLGGLRVLFDQLNTGADHNLVAGAFRVAHACTAQIFLCVLVAIAVGMTRRWIDYDGGLQRPPSRGIRRAGLFACATIFVQLVLGALIRHNDAALTIPWFPHANENGSWIPAYWNFGVTVHFSHRVWALVVLLAIGVFAGRLWAARRIGRILGVLALVLTGMTTVQVFLGALVVWTMRNPHAATVHMLTGAFLLATTWAATFLVHRPRFADGTQIRAASSQRDPAIAAGRA